MDATGIIYMVVALVAVAAAIRGCFALYGTGPRDALTIVSLCFIAWGVQIPVAFYEPVDGTLLRELDIIAAVLFWIGLCGIILGFTDMALSWLSEDGRTAKFLNKPVVAGGLASYCFYELIHHGWLNYWLLERYMAGHPVEYVIGTAFFIGFAALAIRFLEIRTQSAAIENVALSPAPAGGLRISACDALIQELTDLPAKLQSNYLTRRLRDALEMVRRKGSADAIEKHLRYLEDQDAMRMNANYSLVRIVIWAIPILGLLGTVIGITIAIANLDPEILEQSMGRVTSGLKVAFDHTAEALTLTMILMFIKHAIERSEHQLLSVVDERAADQLVGRFQSTGTEGDPNVAAIRRMSEQVVTAVESSVARQAQVWQSTIDETHQQWADVSTSAGHIIQESLSSALRDNLSQLGRQLNDSTQLHAEKLRESVQHYVETLDGSTQRHCDKLSETTHLHSDRLRESTHHHATSLGKHSDVAAEKLRVGLEKLAELLVEALHRHGEVMSINERDIADENRRHLSEVEAALGEAMVVASDRQENLIRRSEDLLQEMQAALMKAAEATIRHQEQLVKQSDVLLRVVDSTGQVKLLEEALNKNLAALARSHRFDEMTVNLTAAIQMLCARVGTVPLKPMPTLDSRETKPASHAA